MTSPAWFDAAVEAEVPFGGGTLRPWRSADAPRLVAAWADAEIARWNPVPPEPSLVVAQRWIDGQHSRLEQGLSIDLVIDTPNHPSVVGEVGLSGFSDQHKNALIGYWLLPEARGAGIAAAAVSAFTAWAHEALDLHVLVARCAAANTASHRVAEVAGYRHEATDASDFHLWRSRKFRL